VRTSTDELQLGWICRSVLCQAHTPSAPVCQPRPTRLEVQAPPAPILQVQIQFSALWRCGRGAGGLKLGKIPSCVTCVLEVSRLQPLGQPRVDRGCSVLAGSDRRRSHRCLPARPLAGLMLRRRNHQWRLICHAKIPPPRPSRPSTLETRGLKPSAPGLLRPVPVHLALQTADMPRARKQSRQMHAQSNGCRPRSSLPLRGFPSNWFHWMPMQARGISVQCMNRHPVQRRAQVRLQVSQSQRPLSADTR